MVEIYQGLLDKLTKGAFMVLLVSTVFYGGFELGAIKERVANHEKLNMHSGSYSSFIPRTELDGRLSRMEKDIQEIKEELRLLNTK